jgi:hypothetical protein
MSTSTARSQRRCKSTRVCAFDRRFNVSGGQGAKIICSSILQIMAASSIPSALGANTEFTGTLIEPTLPCVVAIHKYQDANPTIHHTLPGPKIWYVTISDSTWCPQSVRPTHRVICSDANIEGTATKFWMQWLDNVVARCPLA